MVTEAFSRDLVSVARGRKDKSETCVPPNKLPQVTIERHRGWQFGLDVYEHREEHVFDKLPGDIVRVHYRLSAKLFPIGRSSTPSDWRNLAQIVRSIVLATGYPEDILLPEPLLSIEHTHPNSTMMWMWHGDGSPVDKTVLDGTAMALSKAQAREREIAVKRGWAAPSPTVGRNDDCPCGSGKKYKKCHGN